MKKKYRVTICEDIFKEVYTEAESPEKAEEMVRKAFNQGLHKIYTFSRANNIDYMTTEV